MAKLLKEIEIVDKVKVPGKWLKQKRFGGWESHIRLDKPPIFKVLGKPTAVKEVAVITRVHNDEFDTIVSPIEGSSPTNISLHKSFERKCKGHDAGKKQHAAVVKEVMRSY